MVVVPVISVVIFVAMVAVVAVVVVLVVVAVVALVLVLVVCVVIVVVVLIVLLVVVVLLLLVAFFFHLLNVAPVVVVLSWARKPPMSTQTNFPECGAEQHRHHARALPRERTCVPRATRLLAQLRTTTTGATLSR